jgi:hypothetical protein
VTLDIEGKMRAPKSEAKILLTTYLARQHLHNIIQEPHSSQKVIINDEY